jgi:hypothetical protein
VYVYKLYLWGPKLPNPGTCKINLVPRSDP